jgi:hypothetical protein
MTNDLFVDEEREVWLKGHTKDERFKAALRIDPLLNKWENSCKKMNEWGYNVSLELGEASLVVKGRLLLMTKRERLIRLFEHKEVDRVPVLKITLRKSFRKIINWSIVRYKDL